MPGKLRCGARDVFRFGNSDEVTEVAQFHGAENGQASANAAE